MFLEILTIIIATIIVLGGFLIVASKDDGPLMINGSVLVSFGITALFWFAKVTTPHLRFAKNQRSSGCTGPFLTCLNGSATLGSQQLRPFWQSLLFFW